MNACDHGSGVAEQEDDRTRDLPGARTTLTKFPVKTKTAALKQLRGELKSKIPAKGSLDDQLVNAARAVLWASQSASGLVLINEEAMVGRAVKQALIATVLSDALAAPTGCTSVAPKAEPTVTTTKHKPKLPRTTTTPKVTKPKKVITKRLVKPTEETHL